MVKKPLTPSYDGPYRVLSRRPKTFKVQLPNREVEVSIDRLKPAFLLSSNAQNSDDSLSSKEPGTHPGQNPELPVASQSPKVRMTRRGRVIVRPPRYIFEMSNHGK